MVYKNQLQIIFLQMFIFLCIGCSSKSTTKKNKLSKNPNIIYIMADDLTTQAISAYGGIYKDIAPTPAAKLDKTTTNAAWNVADLSASTSSYKFTSNLHALIILFINMEFIIFYHIFVMNLYYVIFK